MTQQLTIPPAYMWNRIKKILDEQEPGKKHSEKLISNTFRQPVNTQPVNYYLAVTGAGILALIVLKCSSFSKDN